MPGPSERNRADNAEFLRDPNGKLGDGRFAEATDQNAGGRSGPSSRGRTITVPKSTSRRANLVELEDPSQILTFSYNPTTYSIEKEARWDETQVAGGSDTVGYNGSGLTVVSFEALFNDLDDQHVDRPWQRSVEDQGQWLFDRLRTRANAPANPGRGRQGLPYNPAPWFNQVDPTASRAPPVLVLFGVSKPFVCVLKSVRFETDIQGTQAHDILGTDPGDPGFNIRRARGFIVLKEYVNAPDAGDE